MLKAQEDIVGGAEFLDLHLSKTEPAEVVAQSCMIHGRGRARLDCDTPGKIDAHPETGMIGQCKRDEADYGRGDEAGVTSSHEWNGGALWEDVPAGADAQRF